jgi:2-C-methyl-D-erythritol 4-phosphate cytidylyltransferase
MKTQAIVVAAGKGVRLGSNISKSLIEISGVPIIIRTLRSISKSDFISSIILVCRKEDLQAIIKIIISFKINKLKAVVIGGKERTDSVRSGLSCLDKDTDLVLIHDGARPFIDKNIIDVSIKCACRYGACTTGVAVKPTIKVVKKDKNILFVDKTIDRANVWEIQTPQVFKKDIIQDAYKKANRFKATDDAALIEMAGYRVALCPGSYFNIKITTPEDLIFAEAILKEQKAKPKIKNSKNKD